MKVIPREYQICQSCIMDTSDKTLKFNDDGICEYCINFRDNMNQIGFLMMMALTKSCR